MLLTKVLPLSLRYERTFSGNTASSPRPSAPRCVHAPRAPTQRSRRTHRVIASPQTHLGPSVPVPSGSGSGGADRPAECLESTNVLERTRDAFTADCCTPAAPHEFRDCAQLRRVCGVSAAHCSSVSVPLRSRKKTPVRTTSINGMHIVARKRASSSTCPQKPRKSGTLRVMPDASG